jgi:GTP:adenosylcobinamide-phosphate guanylyltransferase
VLPAAMLVGEKAAVTPFGTPVIDNATAELNPLSFAMVTVVDPDPPDTTETLVGLAASVKVAVGMVRAMV